MKVDDGWFVWSIIAAYFFNSRSQAGNSSTYLCPTHQTCSIQLFKVKPLPNARFVVYCRSYKNSMPKKVEHVKKNGENNVFHLTIN